MMNEGEPKPTNQPTQPNEVMDMPLEDFHKMVGGKKEIDKAREEGLAAAKAAGIERAKAELNKHAADELMDEEITPEIRDMINETKGTKEAAKPKKWYNPLSWFNKK